jgi:hypothetical protein
VSSNLILNEDLFLVGNTQFNVNSKVVTEFTGPHGRPQATLTKFPEIQMTEAAQAGYVVSASSTYNGDTVYPYSPWNVFDGKLTEVSGSHGSWLSASGTYDGNGAPSASPAIETTESSNTWTGEWLQLELPHKIQLTKVEVLRELHAYGEDRSPRSGAILGSNNGTTWSFIHSWANIAEGDFLTAAFKDLGTITTAGHYKYIRFVTTAVQATTQSVKCVSMNEIRFYGTPEVETAGNISQDTTLKSIYNTPSNLDANVYLDGDLGATLTNQISGGPALTGTGATYDSAGKYWSLDGSTESNVVTGDLAFQGDQPHSVSLWFNSSNLETNVANSTIYHIGTAANLSGTATHKVRIVNKSLSWNYENDIPLKANTWHHLTHTYEGVGGYRTLYLDGRKVESAYAGDTAGEFPPFPMGGYSQGGYTVTASSEYDATSYRAWEAFNDVNNSNGNDGWVSQNVSGMYNPTYNTGVGSSRLSSTVPFGEWVKLELPYKVFVSYISLWGRGTAIGEIPKSFYIYGSNDDVNWDTLLTVTDNTDINLTTYTDFQMDISTNAYKYFAMVVTKTVGNAGFTGIGDIRLYGHKENDLIRFPGATNVRKYPDTAMVSNGPQRGYVASASKEESTSRQAWKIFNNVQAEGDGWRSTSSDIEYNASGTYVGSSNLGTGAVNGEWVQIQLPYKIKLERFTLQPRISTPIVPGSSPSLNYGRSEFIKNGKIYGSNDGVSWSLVHTITGISASTDTSIVYVIVDSSSAYYKYFGLVITDTNTSSTNAAGTALSEWELYGTEETTPVPVLARLGGAFEGKVANFRVYNKCIKEDQALELWDAQKDQFGLAKSSVTVYKGRVGIGTTEPQAALTVADEVAIPKSGEFPPGPMTNYETHFKDHGLFRATASDTYDSTFHPWMAFNDNQVQNNTFSWGNGLYTLNSYIDVNTNAPTINGVYGAWLQLDFPYKITLDYIIIQPRVAQSYEPEATPGAGNIWGSNDGVNWNLLASFTGFTYGGTTHAGLPETAQVNSTTPYSYFRLQPTKRSGASGADSLVSIGNLSFFGTPETTTKYSTLHDGELTLTKSLNVPRIGPAPDSWIYQVPRRDALEIEFDTSRNIHHGQGGGSLVVNTAGGNNGPHGYFAYGSKYDANTRAFAFDEGDDHISLTRTGAQGNFIHSVSVWVNSRDLNDGETILYFGNFTNTSTGQVAACQIFNDRVQSAFWDNTHDFAYTFVNNTWYHIVWTYNGDGSNGRRAYVNGIEITRTATSGSFVNDNLNLGGSGFALGGNVYNGAVDGELNGYISGFRLYNIALDQGDILKLYEMGRNGPVNYINMVDTSLAIGRHAPTASLDVEGKVKAGGSVTNFTGQHRCVPEGPMEPGLIVSADKNRYVNMKDGLKTGSKAITIDESLPVVALSNVSQDKSCFGVVSSVEGVGTSRSETKGGFISETPKVLGDNRAIVNSLGEGALWVVNTGGPLESGDYVTTSNVAGYGQRQDDDVLHNYTVAKITMDCDFTASNVATQAPKKVETLVTVEEGVWSNLSAYNRSSETQTQYINGENVVLTEGEWSNLATEEQNTYSDTTITTYYEIRRGENLLDENGNIQWEDTDGVEPGYKVRFLTSDGTQTDEANAVHTAAFVGCTYHCG